MTTQLLPFRVDVHPSLRDVASRTGLDELVANTAARAFAVLPHRDQVVIDVGVAPERAIPELGVGGGTVPDTGHVSLWLDRVPDDAGVDAMRPWISSLLVHELHHSSRIRAGAGYGTTLGEAFVSEGLADTFVHEVLPDAPAALWASAHSRDELLAIWPKARAGLHAPPLDERVYRRWFLGSASVPRWSGYALGYRIVHDYLVAVPGRTAAGSVSVPADEILEGFTP